MNIERISRYTLFGFLGGLALLCFQPMSGCSTPAGSGETQQEVNHIDAGNLEKSSLDGVVSEQSQEPVQDSVNAEQSTTQESRPEATSEPHSEPKAEAQPEPRAEVPSGDAGTPEETVVEEPIQEAPQSPENVPEAQVENTPNDKAPQSCTQDADCGKRTCSQVGKICKRNTPICRSGSCVELKVDIPDTTCDTSTGVCWAPKPQCKDTCDCAQGLMCVKDASGEGTCIAGFVPVYCCSNGGCPSGKPCVHRGGGSDVCP